MNKKLYIVALLLVSIILIFIINFLRLKRNHANTEIRFKIFSELLRKIPKESCITSMEFFKNQIISQNNFKDVYFIDLNGSNLDGRNENKIKDWTNLLKTVIIWDGLGEMKIADEKVAYWGRCSQKIIYIAID